MNTSPDLLQLRFAGSCPIESAHETAKVRDEDADADALEAMHAAEEAHGRDVGRRVAHGDRLDGRPSAL